MFLLKSCYWWNTYCYSYCTFPHYIHIQLQVCKQVSRLISNPFSSSIHKDLFFQFISLMEPYWQKSFSWYLSFLLENIEVLEIPWITPLLLPRFEDVVCPALRESQRALSSPRALSDPKTKCTHNCFHKYLLYCCHKPTPLLSYLNSCFFFLQNRFVWPTLHKHSFFPDDPNPYL